MLVLLSESCGCAGAQSKKGPSCHKFPSNALNLAPHLLPLYEVLASVCSTRVYDIRMERASLWY